MADGNRRYWWDTSEEDWWDKNYEDILSYLMKTYKRPNVGKGAYSLAEDWANKGLDWNYADTLTKIFASTGEKYTPTGEQFLAKAFKGLANPAAEAPPFQRPEDYQSGLMNQLNLANELTGKHLQERGVKAPIYGEMIQAPFSAAGLNLDQIKTALSGFQGFRAQDIELLLKEIELEMMIAQASSSGEGGGGGCVVTSACMEAKGLPDNCHELQSLRELRSWMKKSKTGKTLVKIYEIIAPPVVRKINILPNSKKHWETIYNVWVLPAVKLVEQGKNTEAVTHYGRMIKALIDNYGYLTGGGGINAVG